MSIDFDKWEEDLRSSGLSGELLEQKLQEIRGVQRQLELMEKAGVSMEEVTYVPPPPPVQVDMRSLLIGVGVGALAGTAVGAAGAYYLTKDGKG